MSTEIDKSSWGDGPWMKEPDRVEFRHNGMPCLMVRHNTLGHWCGYVGLPPEHPWYGKEYRDDAVNVSVHGGLTYSKECHGNVCHIAQPGEPEHVWWLGFDCAHCDDHSPGLDYEWGHSIYRTLAYVQQQTKELAEQLGGFSCQQN